MVDNEASCICRLSMFCINWFITGLVMWKGVIEVAVAIVVVGMLERAGGCEALGRLVVKVNDKD